MSKLILSKAMGSIPDDMLQEAMAVEKKDRTGWVVFRAAACLAVVIGLLMAAFGLQSKPDGVVTGPGMLTITAFAADQTPVTMTAPDSVQYGQFAVVSPLLGSPFVNALTLSVTDELSDAVDIRFLLYFEGGVFRSDDQSGEMVRKEVSVTNHSTVYWTMEQAVSVPDSVEYRTTAYVDILVYDGEEIIGYTVMRLNALTCEELAKSVGKEVAHKDRWGDVDPKDFIYCDGGDHMTSTYSIEMLASVYFPKVNGEYQHITKKYVADRIEELKKNILS